MSLLFWRKSTGGAKSNDYSEAVSKDEPLPVQSLLPTEQDEDETPPVKVQGEVVVRNRTPIERRYKVPGIGTAAAYADGEAFGGKFTLHSILPADTCSGVIVKVVLHDLDDEGLQVDMPLFVRDFTATTDNNAFAPTDDDNLACKGVISLVTFYNWNVNQLGQNTDPLWIVGESPNLYTQLVIRGAANIAAGAEPWIEITVQPL